MLMKCPECGMAVSNSAKSCTLCGCDIQKKLKRAADDRAVMNKSISELSKSSNEETKKIADILKSCGF